MTALTASSDKHSSLKYDYAGWIPTVSGRLSFRHIGESSHPSESVYANIATAKARFILAYQHRYLSDSLFNGLMDIIARNTGDFWFILSATNPKASADGDEIFGTIYIYKSKKDWQAKIKNLIQSSMHQLHVLQAFPAELDARGAIDVQVAAQYKQITAALRATADIAVEFKMIRDGSSYFSRPTFADAGLEAASTSFAHQSGLGFQKWVSDQAYFFLRDLCHSHQHHSREDDTILMLRPYDQGDAVWRRDIIYSLYYYIIRAKRHDEFPLLNRAIGILAYCRSFKLISAPRFEAAKLHVPKFNDATLKQSLDAKIAEETWRSQLRETKAIRRATTSANWRMLTLTAAAVLVALVAIFAPDALKYPPLHAFAMAFAPFIIPTLKAMVILLVVIFLATTDAVLGMRDILELSNVYRRRAAIVFTIIPVVVLVFAAWELSSPIREILRLIHF